MAKYLKPRRGSKANAIAQKIKLQKGELFMEFPNGYIGKEPGRIVIGDGASSYDSLNYATSATNVFQPFITDPSIYIPRFVNTATSTGAGTINDGMAAINKMGNGSSTSTVTLPTIVSAIKEALVYHGNSITKLNTDLAGKADITELGNYALASTLTNYLAKSSTSVFSTTAHVHSVATTSANGFMSSTDKSNIDKLNNIKYKLKEYRSGYSGQELYYWPANSATSSYTAGSINGKIFVQCMGKLLFIRLVDFTIPSSLTGQIHISTTTRENFNPNGNPLKKLGVNPYSGDVSNNGYFSVGSGLLILNASSVSRTVTDSMYLISSTDINIDNL